MIVGLLHKLGPEADRVVSMNPSGVARILILPVGIEDRSATAARSGISEVREVAGTVCISGPHSELGPSAVFAGRAVCAWDAQEIQPEVFSQTRGLLVGAEPSQSEVSVNQQV